MIHDSRNRRPRTPLLFVLLGAALLVAATTILMSHLDVSWGFVQPLVATSLVAAVGGTRLFRPLTGVRLVLLDA